MSSQLQLQALPWQSSYANKPRRFGIEIEFSGLELADVQQLVARHLALTTKASSRYRYNLTGDPAGDWLIELDFQLLTKMGEQKIDTDSVKDNLQASLETLLAAVAKPLVPLELVSPPLPFSRLNDVTELITLLHKAGAKGSSESLRYAFGLQLNPEIPSAEVTILLRIIQAFVCLQDWLRQREHIDVVRSLTSYIEPYAKAYQQKITEDNYQPALSELIDDYLEFNPSRNRALDCLPLFLHLDEQRVRAVTDDKLIKARPTFHYRLPSCEIHRKDWSLQHAWDGWAEVELLAADPARLARCMAAYQRHLTNLSSTTASWITKVEQQWLNR
ncbi:Putative amidoligase enzyme [Arsukibacterium tuosuense]|uniref:Putative amidoligase enzyme n=1 Tax=Arsukibacterium tuosuense TaxID=1323745 RepID=A0A285I946_9GAMM|nr:amidoligase family protein [Arsukibacterium tuosuense]SNY44337.1 Putative amidoligase enzyme [Arsukibacterium tuosuense]